MCCLDMQRGDVAMESEEEGGAPVFFNNGTGAEIEAADVAWACTQQLHNTYTTGGREKYRRC